MPAPSSTATSKPAASSFAAASGTSATRRSPAPDSFGTAIFTERDSTEPDGSSEGGPDLELLPRAADHVVGELARAGMAAEVGRSHPLRYRLEAGLANRATGLLPGLVGVREERGAGEDHRHRVRDVLAEER